MDKMPEDGAKAFFVAALLPVPISVLAAIFSVTVLGVYGWSVFTAVPLWLASQHQFCTDGKSDAVCRMSGQLDSVFDAHGQRSLVDSL